MDLKIVKLKLFEIEYMIILSLNDFMKKCIFKDDTMTEGD